MKKPDYDKNCLTERKAIILAPTRRNPETDMPKKEYWPDLTRGNTSERAGKSI